MLKDNVQMPLHRRFKSGTEWEPIGFFSDALCEAKTFDLMLGFFSSSAINVLSDSFATFIYNGGKMRMIINDILSKEDKATFMVGESDVDLPTFDLSDIKTIKRTLSERNKHFFDCLAYLIRNDRVEIKIITPKDNCGISHTKAGIFSDNASRIAFEGSCNFSKTALVDNIESFTITCDWDGPTSEANINEIAKDFEQTFSGKNDTVRYEDVKDIKTNILSSFPDKSIQRLLKEEYDLLKNRQKTYLTPTIKKVLKRAKDKVASIIYKQTGDISVMLSDDVPSFPYTSGPRDYQKLAFEKWKDNGQRGLFAMATGTGKTITALNCLLEIYIRKGYYKAVILVPTITLVNQWEEECRKFSFQNITKVFSKNTDWKDEVGRLCMDEKYNIDSNSSYIIIATYASFSRRKTFDMLNSLDRRRVLLIADECHNMGSETMLKLLKEVRYGRRIGLSATPERQFDDRGNRMLRKFFGAEDGYTYEYSMEEAIKNGVLCKYKYYPHLIRLTPTEMSEYIDLSERIAKYFNFEKECFDKTDEILKKFLLKRKRIIHKAYNKLGVFKQIISERFAEKGNLKYSLVYVPEGNKPDYIEGEDDFDIADSIGDDEDADHLINVYTKAVSDLDETITVKRFVSGQKDRDEVLEDFANGRIQVLTSMKCLDEGVDVPRSELAIFCSSTGNPRQFIQRRGRVLRTHKDKKLAILHDLVVAPEVIPCTDSYRMEQSLLRGELKRVSNFARLSENPSQSEIELHDVMNYYASNLNYNNQDND
ncbi:MAG: DEAD/DEAH box helicase family protein [Prevotella sp.]